MHLLYRIIITLLFISLVIFVILWISSSDATYEPWTVLVEGCLIPLFLFLDKKTIKNETKGKEQKNNINQINTTFIAGDSIIFNSKAKIIIKVEMSTVRDTEVTGEYRYQLSFLLHAVGGSVYIREIQFINNGCVMFEQAHKLNYLFEYEDRDFLKLSKEDFKTEHLKRKENRYPVDKIVVMNDEWKYYTIFDYIDSERLMDGYENFRLKNWNLLVKYNDGVEEKISFDFSIHNESSKIPVEWTYQNFE